MHKALVLILLLLAACSSQPPVTDVPFYTSTPRDISGESQFMGTDLPLEFIGGNPQLLGTGGSFSYTVNGAVISQQNSGMIVYSHVPRFDTIPAHNLLYISASDADSSEMISFEFSPNLPVGQYPLLAPSDFIMGTVSAQFQRLAAQGDAAVMESYNQNIEGMLNLTVAGETISGDFHFTAKYIQTSPEGEVQSQQVEVTGTFADVAYQAVGSDPFEITVPLPTRIFTGTEVPVATTEP